MKFDNVRLLVKDYDKCFKFYTEKLGFEAEFDLGIYASFKVADGITGLAIFTSDPMAQVVGNEDKIQPTDCREKSAISFSVECVDTTYKTLKAKGVEFINEPFDWETAGMRAVHLRDPEDNLLEIQSEGKSSTPKFDNVCLFINDFDKCFKFYSEKLGFETTWNDEKSYASFNVADGITGFSLFLSDLNAPVVGSVDKKMPTSTDYREKSMVSFVVECVDTTYKALKAKGVEFINEPFDWEMAGMRAVHLRDPEDNLIEIYAPLATE
jgi:catechol 2,3-dioxygenase-like lactoylglutathione lyase family enzyme